MLRASSAELRLTVADLEAALQGLTQPGLEPLQVELADGALILRQKVQVDRLPVAVPVELRLTLHGVRPEGVEARVTWTNLPLLPTVAKEVVLQQVFESLPGRYTDGLWRVDLAELVDPLPVTAQLSGLEIRADGLICRLAEIAVYPIAAAADAGVHALVPVPSQEEAEIPEHQGYYRQLREKAKEYAAQKAPRWVQPLVPWLLAVPDFFVLLVRLARDERVPALPKVIAGVAIAYFLSPVDLLPDAIPLVGQVDDLAVGLFALDQITGRIPPGIADELWPGEGRVLDLIRDGTDLFARVLPARMVDSIRRMLSREQQPH